MKFILEHTLCVTPATFWQSVFFDAAYNQQLYAALGFAEMHVTSFESPPDGAIRRTLRAEPPLYLPAVLKRKLGATFFYTEHGHFDIASQAWMFRSMPNIMSDQVSITGVVRLTPHPEGATHSIQLEARVTAWGLGRMIEPIIERNSRESFATTASFTNRWAMEKGLV